MFLHWVKGKGIVEHGDNDGDDEDEVEVRGCCSYKVSKKPRYGNVTVEALVNKFSATDEHFLWYLYKFLRTLPIPLLN